MGESNKPNTVTIKRIDNLLGHNSVDVTDNTMLTRSDLLKKIGMLLASSVFEEYYLREHSTSCSDDFDKINSLFDTMERCHMLKPVYPDKKEKFLIRDKILSVLRERIIDFIRDHDAVINDMHTHLDEHETLYQDSINELLDNRLTYHIDINF